MDPIHKDSIPGKEAEEITVENKELSFKLDEPITAHLVPTALNIRPFINIKEEDSLSFVVLGKDSVEAQASLLASYVDIQQKSMSIDYKSMVSSLSITEMQHRLTEMLQENVKLRETLKQNNESMKQQFNTLAMWQEEVTKVHQSHKQKFAETKELINHLKKENADLKNKLLLFHSEDTGYQATSATSEFNTINASVNQAELEQNMPTLIGTISKKELESAMISLNCELHGDSYVERLESLKCSEACSAKDQEIACLKESIALLEQKLQSVLTPIQIHDLSETSSNLSRQKFVQNMKQYNDMLQELTNCFVKQTERFAAIEKGLKEITDILRLDDDNSKMEHEEKLCQYCKQLAEEQIKIITDRQTLIKSQNQYQKIFSDYNSILYELEITMDENAKLNVLKDNSARENLQTSEQLERDKQSLEEEKKIFDQEKENLENEKKSLESQKKSLDMERVSLHDERKLLEEEKISLNEEKMSLDHQSQLYENCERDLHNEKKQLQVCNDQLLGETNSLRQQIEEKNAEFKKIMEQLAQSAEEIQLLRSQLSLYEEDFQQEKKLKEALIEEKNTLTTELHKQIEFNKQLQGSAKSNDEQSKNDTMITCPKCSMIFLDLSNLMKHIERCLDS